MRSFILLILCMVASPLLAQRSSEELIEIARTASAPYADLESAIAAGYRKIGPDLPNMGEHWIQPRYAVRPSFDPYRPSVLTYVRVEGTPILTGVAYTIGLASGQTAPPPPAPGMEWHFHSGGIEEEIFGGMHQAHDGFRVGMLHAWVWTDNPDGVFEADNWGLSFQRLGLPIPEHVPPAAAKALFLLEGGVDHYMRLIDSAVTLAPELRGRVMGHFRTSAASTRRLVNTSTHETPPLDELVVIWNDLWQRIRDDLKASDWNAVRVLSR